MNQRRGWEDEATSRAVNAQPWEPLPGMAKKRCSQCRYSFAVPIADGQADDALSRLCELWDKDDRRRASRMNFPLTAADNDSRPRRRPKPPSRRLVFNL